MLHLLLRFLSFSMLSDIASKACLENHRMLGLEKHHLMCTRKPCSGFFVCYCLWTYNITFRKLGIISLGIIRSLLYNHWHCVIPLLFAVLLLRLVFGGVLLRRSQVKRSPRAPWAAGCGMNRMRMHERGWRTLKQGFHCMNHTAFQPSVKRASQFASKSASTDLLNSL